jgi:hypothetical protein
MNFRRSRIEETISFEEHKPEKIIRGEGNRYPIKEKTNTIGKKQDKVET